MIKRIKIFILRLFCAHYWLEDIASTDFRNGMAVYGQGIMKAYICKRCGKQTFTFIEPISYIGG